MKKNKPSNSLTSFSEHLDKQHGIRGTAKREKYEQEYETFKLGVLIQEMREKQHLTQEQLASKCGTT
ncbi:MAG TPA: helix-turn-helix transcriptional regulator, partial [Cytophagaceae bacterium]|nr:helix-turn-helix transcriptional regulator [Cytophagaceae bacterium]